jgi:lipopolysaccharide/colanic/teichoic acid biosynthesis glycosyltransferase
MLRIDSRVHSPSSRARLLSRVSIFDVAWAAASPALAYVIRNGSIDRADAVAIYCAVALVAALLTFQLFKISQPISRFFSAGDAVEVAKACAISVAVAGAFLFTFTRMDETPRSIPLIHYFVLAAGLIGGRSISRVRRGWREARKPSIMAEPIENIVIVGTSRVAWFYSRLVEELAAGEAQIIALLDERPQFQYRSLNGHLIAGSPLHIAKIFDEYATHGVEIHKIVMALPPEGLSGAAWVEINRFSEERSITLEVLPERLWLGRRSTNPTRIQPDAPRHEAALTTNHLVWKCKRAFDIFFATVVMLVLAPVAAIVSVTVLIDVGFPVVFWQQRVGRFGRPLHVYKFRTMRSPFDRKGHPVPESERLSSIGRFLRATRLDEIPQLWNILTGGMSVVGPRPLLPIDQPKTSSIRLHVSPGLTGLAQISGGKLISVEEKDALDEHYVQHASVFLDLYVLVRTVWVMFRGDRRNEAVIAAALVEKRGRDQFKTEISRASTDAAVDATKAKAIIRMATANLARRSLLVGSRKQLTPQKSPIRF